MNHISPSATKKQAILKAVQTFEAVAREWHGKPLYSWKTTHAANLLHRLEPDIFPNLGMVTALKAF